MKKILFIIAAMILAGCGADVTGTGTTNTDALLAREVTRRASHAESRKHEESLEGLFDSIDSGVSPGAPAMRAPCTCTVSSLTRVLKELDDEELQKVGAFLSTIMGTSIYTSVSFPAPVEVAKRLAKMEEIYTRGQRWL